MFKFLLNLQAVGTLNVILSLLNSLISETFCSFKRVPLSSTPQTPQFNTTPSVPHQLSSTPTQFHTKNPSVTHKKTLFKLYTSELRGFVELRGFWCGTEGVELRALLCGNKGGCVELRGFLCEIEGFLVWNWGDWVELRGLSKTFLLWRYLQRWLIFIFKRINIDLS